MCTSFCVEVMFSIFLVLYLEVKLLGRIVGLCLTFWGTDRLLSKVAAPFCISTTRVWGIQFLCILTSTWYCLSFTLAILVYVKWYLVVLICISLWLMILCFFLCILGHLYSFLGEISTQILCAFFNWVCHLIFLDRWYLFCWWGNILRDVKYFDQSHTVSEYCFPIWLTLTALLFLIYSASRLEKLTGTSPVAEASKSQTEECSYITCSRTGEEDMFIWKLPFLGAIS